MTAALIVITGAAIAWGAIRGMGGVRGLAALGALIVAAIIYAGIKPPSEH